LEEFLYCDLKRIRHDLNAIKININLTMVSFFDYVYYRVCVFYDKNKDSSPGVSALLVVCLLQFFNISTILLLIQIAVTKRINISSLLVVSCIVMLLVVNGFRYNKLNYQVLRGRLANTSAVRKRRKESYVALYLIISTATVFILAIYLGSRKW
jgi:hypothetical protein